MWVNGKYSSTMEHLGTATSTGEAEFKGLARQVAQLQGHVAPSYAVLEDARRMVGEGRVLRSECHD